jgi:phosphoglycerate kinase
LLTNPDRPFATILGGAKISSKVAVLTNLLPRINALLLGGGIASTFLKAQGHAVGDSLVENDFVQTAREVLGEADRRKIEVLVPTDVVVAEKFAADSPSRTVAANRVPPGWRIMDAGPESVASYGRVLSNCGTIFWNGTLGVAEFPAFAKGSLDLAEALAEVKGTVVVGGGETAALVEQAGLRDRYSHVSTGGGASLEFLEGRTLPGVAALNDR